MIVTLTATELYGAAMCGVSRHILSRRSNRNNTLEGEGLNDWSVDINGAIAECAFAKQHGLYWGPSVNTFKLPDVGADWQVRGTTLAHGGLPIRPGDNPDHRYALVIINVGDLICRVAGWIMGGDAMQRERRPADSKGPAWWLIPQHALNPMGIADGN